MRLTIRKPRVDSMIMGAFILYSLFLTQTLFGTNNYILLYNLHEIAITIICVIVLATSKMRIRLSKIETYAYAILLVPYIALTLISIVEVSIGQGFSLKETLSANYSPMLMCVAAIIAYRYFGDRIVDVIYYMACINYIVYIIYFVNMNGLGGIIEYIVTGEEIGPKILEVHEATFIFGLMFVYYVINGNFKQNKVKGIVCLCFAILGYKRILFLAVIVGLVTYWIVRKKSKKITIIYAVSLLLMCLGWLFFVTSDLYELVAAYFLIELNSRTFTDTGLYARLNGYYTISPSYIGHGVGFVNTKMREYASRVSGFVTTGFHNDILRYYIDIGFIPCILYFFNMTVLNARRIIKMFSQNQANKFLCLLCVTLIGWTTDNLASYPNYLFVQNILFLEILLGNKYMGIKQDI